MRTRDLEILAPAGGGEQLVAAVRAGADAVYLGTQRFNARRSAHNFDEAALGDAVSYCHARGVDVHVTFNTLLRDDELPDALAELGVIAHSGADAVIVQDLGAAKLVREHCPNLAMHASTQLTVHNVAGARELEELGFTRAVLARELSLREIELICAATPLEVEVFVHGALCMCVSGCCYLSSMLGGRSGNRGRCAQPCRLNFVANGREYALSLKDMSHLDHLAALRSAGVRSLKIEGRMKRPEYVAAAVHACRAARSGDGYDAENLKNIFSRGGFTDGYLTGKRTLDMFGYRTKEDVDAFRGAQSVGELTRTEFPGVPVSMALKVEAGRPVVLEAGDGQRLVRVEGLDPEPARTRPADADSVRQSLVKTGGTPFYLDAFSAQIGPGLAVRGATLNALRREALDKLLQLRGEPEPGLFFDESVPEPIPYEPRPVPSVRVRAECAEQIPPETQAEKIILPLGELLRAPLRAAQFGERLAAEIPALVFPDREDAVREQLREARELGVREALCENIGAVALAREAGLRPLGGHGLNILNSEALAEFERMGVSDLTVSFELSLDRIRKLGGTALRGILAYGSLPLMRLRACPMQGPNGCGDCDGRRRLRDRKGVEFTVLCAERRCATLLNSVPLYLSDKRIGGVDFHTFWFTTETAEEARAVLAAYRSRVAPPAAHTNGLYFREIE